MMTDLTPTKVPALPGERCDIVVGADDAGEPITCGEPADCRLVWTADIPPLPVCFQHLEEGEEREGMECHNPLRKGT